MAATNKCLAKSNKPRTGAKATEKRRNTVRFAAREGKSRRRSYFRAERRLDSRSTARCAVRKLMDAPYRDPTSATTSRARCRCDLPVGGGPNKCDCRIAWTAHPNWRSGRPAGRGDRRRNLVRSRSLRRRRSQASSSDLLMRISLPWNDAKLSLTRTKSTSPGRAIQNARDLASRSAGILTNASDTAFAPSLIFRLA